MAFCPSPEDQKKFNCEKCPTRTQKLRRCREDREDFSVKDGPFWPMNIFQGGSEYGFCPGKATWDIELISEFRELCLIAEMNQFPDGKPINEQPIWLVDVVSWFLPKYKAMITARNMNMILGSPKAKTNKPLGDKIKQSTKKVN